MAQHTELFLAPDPNGNPMGSIERAGCTESLGTSSAGRLVALNADGQLSDSMLPYATAVDVVESEFESAALLSQVPDVSGRAWKWFGVSALLSWLEGRVMDMVSPVGTLRWDVASGDTSYWLVLNDRKVGNATSGAELVGDRYLRLFTRLWEACPWLKVYNPAGQEVTRNATARADWDAGRRISLPDLRGRKLTAAGKGAGIQNRPLGNFSGADEVTLNEANLPAHRHGTTEAVIGTSENISFISDVSVQSATAATDATTTVTNAVVANASPAAAETQKPDVTVTMDNAAIELHEHDLNGSVTVTDPGHPHQAASTFTPDGTEGGAVATTVQNATTGITAVVAGKAVNQAATTGHKHKLNVAVQGKASTGEHGHAVQVAVVSKATTTVSVVPTVTLRKTTLSRTFTTVGDQTASTGTAGQGVAFSALDPDFAAALYIRY